MNSIVKIKQAHFIMEKNKHFWNELDTSSCFLKRTISCLVTNENLCYFQHTNQPNNFFPWEMLKWPLLRVSGMKTKLDIYIQFRFHVCLQLKLWMYRILPAFIHNFSIYNLTIYKLTSNNYIFSLLSSAIQDIPLKNWRTFVWYLTSYCNITLFRSILHFTWAIRRN